jgi:prevent-host-death family protein
MSVTTEKRAASPRVRAPRSGAIDALKTDTGALKKATDQVSITVTALRESLSETVNVVAYQHRRVVLERNGKPAAAMVSIEDFELLKEIEDKLDLVAAREALKEPGEVSWDALKKKLGL